jgi:uncharacterized protein (DUF58 family)
MLGPRGISVSLAGLAMWFTARVIGSPGLEVVSIGLASLPFLAALFVRFTPRRLEVRRRLSEVRVAPGTRVHVDIEIRNGASARTPLLLLEDRLPAALGRPARLVVTNVPPRGRQRVGYTVLPQSRGRYGIGPLWVDVTDPFGLTRGRVRVDRSDELLVTPEVEDLTTAPEATTGHGVGAARARQLMRTGEEYFTMRSYQEGDDLRRIHWPSVARTGELMIRQNEASRRASALVFLDDRETGLGPAHGPAFERAVSCAASVGMLLLEEHFTLRFATPELIATPVSEDRFLDVLSRLGAGKSRTLAPALVNLRVAASPETSLVLVGPPPAPQELPGLVRAATGYGPKLAILVQPADPTTAPPSRRTAIEGRSTQAVLALSRSGWDVLLLTPSTRLAERWHTPRERPLASNA